MLKNSLIFLTLLLLASCTRFHDFRDYIKSPVDRKMFTELDGMKGKLGTQADQIQWISRITGLFGRYQLDSHLLTYLLQSVQETDDTHFQSLLYYTIGDLYWKKNSNPLFIHYFLKIHEEDYPVLINQQPVGYIIALKIINAGVTKDFDDYNLKIRFYKLLITQYRDWIDIYYTLYELSKHYKKYYDIKNAIKIMSEIAAAESRIKYSVEFLNLADIKKEVEFYYTKKTWIYQDLNQLIRQIKKAVYEKNEEALKGLTSPEDFQIMMTQKSNQDIWRFDDLGISERFSDKILFADAIEPSSGAGEAYLKTDNWNFYNVSTWYLYFRQVDYPYDLKINGGWEWKGIYLGSRF